MAIVMNMRWRGVTPETYETLRGLVQWEELPAAGGLLHIASFDADGIRVCDVWESQEQFMRFIEERLRPATEQVGVPGEPEVEFSDLHAVWSPNAELALT